MSNATRKMKRGSGKGQYKNRETGQGRREKKGTAAIGFFGDRFWKSMVYGYLLLPFFIFALGWLKWYIAILAAATVAYAFVKSVREDRTSYQELLTGKGAAKLLIALAVIVVWVILSGIGGICFQNRDHGTRSTVYRALQQCPWPVVSEDGTRTLIYYLGFWLPSAAFGKLFGYDAGYKFQIVWAVLGVYLMFVLLCVWRKKVSLWPLLVLIFFSGLDIVGYYMDQGLGVDYPWTMHLEWWAEEMQFTAMTTQLFWVFNQSIPAWLCTMLLLVQAEQENRRNMLLALSTLMLTATFPFVGLMPFVVYFLVRRLKLDKEHMTARIKDIFTVQNMIGVFVIGIVSLLYLIGNMAAGNISRDSITAFTGTSESPLVMMLSAAAGAAPAALTFMSSEAMLLYLKFFLLEFGLYAILIARFEYKDPLYYIIIGVLLGCPFIQVGGAKDFCMRASIPALFLLMLLVIKDLEVMARKKRLWVWMCPLLLVLLIGAATPFNEIHRTVEETEIRRQVGKTMLWPGINLSKIMYYENLSGSTDSIFMKYLAK